MNGECTKPTLDILVGFYYDDDGEGSSLWEREKCALLKYLN